MNLSHLWIVRIMFLTAQVPALNVRADFSQDVNVEQDGWYIKGKEQYYALKQNMKLPRYSECWTKAIEDLETGCKVLTDDLQHRLSLSFANCFFLKTGRDTYPCDELTDVAECTIDMPSEAYNTFSNFFTHTQNVCFFLQAQVWQESTEGTINKLTENSAQVADQLQDSTKLQTDIINKQTESIRNQDILIERGHHLEKTLESSTTGVTNMLQEFKRTTDEQRALIFEVFDRVTSLQSVVMGEFTGFYSVIFYTVAIIVSYLVTSTPRTSGARFWLFVVMTVNMAVERLIVFTDQSDKENTLDVNSVLYQRMWICRKIFTTIAAGIWITIAFRYEDINRCNHKLLKEIKRELEKIKSNAPESLKEVTAPDMNSSFSSQMGQGDGPTHLANGFIPSSYHAESNQDGASESGSEDSFSSIDSGLSDHSFQVDPNRHSDSESSDDDSFVTLSNKSSRDGTPAIEEELRFLRESTPFRELSLTSPVSSPSKAVGREPIRSKGRRSAPTPPVVSSPASRYNLRRRSDAPLPNPLIVQESPVQFAKSLAQVAALNRYMTRAMAKQLHVTPDRSGNFFSSDED